MLLFLLIRLEVLVLRFEPSLTLLALSLLPIISLARVLATAIPVGLPKRWQSFVPGTAAGGTDVSKVQSLILESDGTLSVVFS